MKLIRGNWSRKKQDEISCKAVIVPFAKVFFSSAVLDKPVILQQAQQIRYFRKRTGEQEERPEIRKINAKPSSVSSPECRSKLPSRRSSYGMASRGPSTTTLPIAIAMAVAMSVMANGLCPTQCRCDDESLYASCAYAGLEVVPIQLNPEIRHLDLSNNRVGNIHLTFGFYGNLEILDLTSNAIHTLGSDNFVFQKNLITLNVSGNAVKALAKNSLQGLDSLRELNLASNNISDMDEQTFKATSELEVLNLSDNSITSLPEGLLKYLHKIRTLILNGNFLLEIPTENLALAPSLENVDLSDNLIQELDRDSLPSLPSLVSLNLANNVIRNIADDAFDRLPDLLHLDLSGNNLTSVPTSALARLNVLSNLILSRNPLGTLEAGGFRDLFELRSLELNDCTIVSVHARAFADNVNLERISLDAAGCLAATATILALIAHLTRSKRKKRLAYAAPNRPEFLVYVGRNNDELDKNGAESYSRRLLTRNEDTPYDTPRAKPGQRSPAGTVQPQDANIYETPRYARPASNRRETVGNPTFARQTEEGVYAVADVTDLRDEPPEVLSLYRMQSPATPRSSVQRLDYGYDYEYDYDYESPLPQKPHVVLEEMLRFEYERGEECDSMHQQEHAYRIHRQEFGRVSVAELTLL
ncbi:Carboxypeptidase N subunit 2 [Melipona quadrifasciata]|uniref:Carboxypeptidase N subunit 2 n=1 Tax=Melipona quadrifasciata TaxID=166423 RepID=A0A0M8ZX42_9HYME|nr:Carboxypeptidase N subunit 2 [Melipona quadrifasciata]